MTGAVVSVGPITFYGDRYRGKGHFHIGPNDQDMTGFFDGVQVEWEPASRERYGDYPSTPRFPAREPHLSGFYAGESDSELIHDGMHLRSLYGRELPVTVKAGGEFYRLSAEVRQASFSAASFAPEATYSLDLYCRDPRMFSGGYKPSGTSVSLFHYGAHPAPLKITVTATSAMSGYTINGPNGKKFIVTASLAAGASHEIDMETGWLRNSGGAILLAGVSRADLWDVPTGPPTTMSLSPTSGAGTITAEFADTYI